MNNNKHRKEHYILDFFLVSLCFVYCTSFALALIASGSSAVNLAGQLSGGSPIYTEGSADDGEGSVVATGFNTPWGVDVDTNDHRMFVADYGNNRILIFNLNSSDQLADYTADNVLGQTDFVSNSSATTQTGLSGPMAVEYGRLNIDGVEGEEDVLFVADRNNNRILLYNIDSISDGEDAAKVLGQVNFTSGGASRSQSRLFWPEGLEFDDTNDRLFVADSGCDRIMVFDLSSGVTDGMNASNVLCQENFTADDITADADNCYGPYAVTYDSTNQKLFVADSGHKRVLVFNISGGITNGMDASNVLGQTNFSNTSSTKTNPHGFTTIRGLSFDNDGNRLFTADQDYNRVLVFELSGGISDGMDASYVLGQPDYTTTSAGTTATKISGPKKAAYNSSSNKLFVVESNNHRVMMFDVSNNTAPTVGTVTPAQMGDGTGYLTTTVAVDDGEDDDLKVKVEYSDDGGSTWYDPDLVSVTATTGTPDLDDAETYQIGTNTAVSTASGSNTLTITWDTKSASNGSGSLDNTDQSNIQIKITANDGTTDGDAATSSSFEVDNLDPTGLTALNTGAVTASSIPLTWTAVTETNWESSPYQAQYEINYGQIQVDVQNREGTALEWTTVEDAALATKVTTSTEVTGLSANTLYYLKIWANDSYGNEQTVTDVAAYTLANQVTGAGIANGTDKDNYKLTLTWTDQSQSGMKIEQDTDCDGYETTIYDNTSANDTSPKTITSLSANTCYKFRISSYNGDGVLNTTSRPETSEITTPPAQPTSLATSSNTTSTIIWDWDDVTAATDYYIYRSSDDAYIGSVGGSTSAYTQTTITDGGATLSANTQYTIYVRAINANGTGIASSAASAYTEANIPTSLAHTNQATDAMRWTWASGGAQKDYYASSTNPVATIDDWTTDEYWNQSSLTANNAVVASVKARNDGLEETNSISITRYTTQNTPTGITEGANTVDSIIVSAAGTFPNLDTGSSGLYFENTTAETNSGWLQTNSWTNSSLSANTAYSYRVKARNGDSDETAFTDTTSIYSAQNAPIAVINVIPTTTSLTVAATGTFPNLTEENSGLYFWDTLGETNSGWIQTPTWENSILSPNSNHLIYVKARNGDEDETADSPALSINTLANAPETPTINNPTTTTLDVTLDTNGNPSTTEFAIQEVGSGNYAQADGTLGTSAVWQTNTAWGTATVTGLGTNTSYEFQAKARNGDNVETAFSTSASLYTLATAPAAGSANQTNYTASIAWGANGNPDSTTYCISRSGAASGSLGCTTNLSIGDTVSLVGTYSYTVYAQNGDSVQSSPVVVGSLTVEGTVGFTSSSSKAAPSQKAAPAATAATAPATATAAAVSTTTAPIDTTTEKTTASIETKVTLGNATSTVIDTIASAKTEQVKPAPSKTPQKELKASTKEIETAIENVEIKKETVPVKTQEKIEKVKEEVKLVKEVVTGNSSEEKAAQVQEKVEKAVSAHMETALAKATGTESGSGGGVIVHNKIGNKVEKIKVSSLDKVEIIVDIGKKDSKNNKTLLEKKNELKKEGKELIVVDEKSNLMGDGISDLYKITHDLPLLDDNPDDDDFTIEEEIYLGLDSLVSDKVPDKPRVTNVGEMKVGNKPSFRGSGKPGETVDLFLIKKADYDTIVKAKNEMLYSNVLMADMIANVEPAAKRIYVGTVIIDDKHKWELTPTENLENGEYYTIPVNKDGEIGEVSAFVVDSERKIADPEIEYVVFDDKIGILEEPLKMAENTIPRFDAQTFISNSFVEKRAVIRGKSDPGASLFVTFKSVITSSVIISDANGDFEIDIKPDLPEGEHDALVYVFDEENNLLSNVVGLLFRK